MLEQIKGFVGHIDSTDPSVVEALGLISSVSKDRITAVIAGEKVSWFPSTDLVAESSDGLLVDSGFSDSSYNIMFNLLLQNSSDYSPESASQIFVDFCVFVESSIVSSVFKSLLSDPRSFTKFKLDCVLKYGGLNMIRRIFFKGIAGSSNLKDLRLALLQLIPDDRIIQIVPCFDGEFDQTGFYYPLINGFPNSARPQDYYDPKICRSYLKTMALGVQ